MFNLKPKKNVLDIRAHRLILCLMNSSDRKRIINMALTRAQPGSGSMLHILRESPPSYNALSSLPDFGNIRFAIVGGLATACYMPERMTLDTDILVTTEDLSKVEEILKTNNSVMAGSLTIGGSSWKLSSGRVLDVIALNQDWVSDALDSAIRDNKGCPFVSLPYLILMKLEAGRLQDLADISRMLGFAEETQLTEVQKLIRKYRPQDIDDLESMIQLGKLEH